MIFTVLASLVMYSVLAVAVGLFVASGLRSHRAEGLPRTADALGYGRDGID
jgi:hypothetical protein